MIAIKTQALHPAVSITFNAKPGESRATASRAASASDADQRPCAWRFQ
jgi:hypothetical protein